MSYSLEGYSLPSVELDINWAKNQSVLGLTLCLFLEWEGSSVDFFPNFRNLANQQAIDRPLIGQKLHSLKWVEFFIIWESSPQFLGFLQKVPHDPNVAPADSATLPLFVLKENSLVETSPQIERHPVFPSAYNLQFQYK